jgi:hypothetical protein
VSKTLAAVRRSGEAAYRAAKNDEGGVMSQYMLLLYSTEPTAEEHEARWAEMPLWTEVTEGLREIGRLVANGALHPAGTATTVRVRSGDVELTDGPFAVTKEVLAGYYVLECADLDEALKHAARLPSARYGSVEVRPIIGLAATPAPSEAARAKA